MTYTYHFHWFCTDRIMIGHKKRPASIICTDSIMTRAATWQNQQSDCAPSEDSDQPGHPPSLIRVFAVRMKKPWVLSYPSSAQRRLWPDFANVQADLSLRWAHSHFIGFVMSRLIFHLTSFVAFYCRVQLQVLQRGAPSFLLEPT